MAYLFDHVATHRAGEHGYYAERKRGTIDVWADNRRYIYKKPNPDVPVLMVKHSILDAFEANGNCYRITGRFPSYTIESI